MPPLGILALRVCVSVRQRQFVRMLAQSKASQDPDRTNHMEVLCQPKSALKHEEVAVLVRSQCLEKLIM